MSQSNVFLLILVFCFHAVFAAPGPTGTIEGYVSSMNAKEVVIYDHGTLIHVPRTQIKQKNLRIGTQVALVLDLKVLQSLERTKLKATDAQKK
jgi:hypothetical protein